MNRKLKIQDKKPQSFYERFRTFILEIISINRPRKGQKLPSYSFKGAFDNTDIREKAYNLE
jgi:hypothetical protein